MKKYLVSSFLIAKALPSEIEFFENNIFLIFTNYYTWTRRRILRSRHHRPKAIKFKILDDLHINRNNIQELKGFTIRPKKFKFINHTSAPYPNPQLYYYY
jgi:hypothetical protein